MLRRVALSVGLGAGLLFASSGAWAASVSSAEDHTLVPDSSLSNEELFEMVAAETSSSNVGRPPSVRAYPDEGSCADDPAPEPLPARGGGALASPVAGGRAPLRPTVRPTDSRLPAPVPLRR